MKQKFTLSNSQKKKCKAYFRYINFFVKEKVANRMFDKGSKVIKFFPAGIGHSATVI
jgi:hypothetical protein